jgi:hypothetical protein
MKKAFILSSIIIFLVGLLIILGIKANSKDIPVPDTSDLSLNVMQLPDQENAYTFFREAANSLQWPDEDSLAISIFCRKTWNEDCVNQLISKNQEMLSLIEKGLECSAFQSLGASLFDNIKPHLEWATIARVIVLRSMYEFKKGNHEKAFEFCLNLLRFGSLIVSKPGCVIDFQSGLLSVNMAYDQFEHLLVESSLSEKMLENLLAQLKSLSINQGMVVALKSEYQWWSESIDEVATSGTFTDVSRDISQRWPQPGRYSCHPNRTRMILSDYYRKLIENVPLPYAKLKLPNKKDFVEPIVSRLWFLQSNGLGKLILTLVPDPNRFDGLFTKKCGVQCNLSGLHLVVACRLYELKHGHKPDTLMSLVPEFLEDVPIDPYDGKLFRYLHEKALIYSVGYDLIDSTSGTEPSKSQKTTHTDDLIYLIHAHVEHAAPDDWL